MSTRLRIGRLVQSENGEESSVDAPLFFWCEMAGQDSESIDIDSTDVFDKNPSRCPIDLDLGSERCWFGAPGSRGDQNDGPGKKRVRLHDDSEAFPLLFMTHTLVEAEVKYVTPLHGGSP